MTDRVSQRFGDYRLVRFLGRGSFGDVYLGEHVHESTLAAIKVLQARLTSGDLREFINEARSTFRLKHPHIVQLLDFGINADDTLFLVMDYALNGTLRQRHPKGTRLPLDTLISYVTQITSALQYAHDRRLIHRDVKPENILVGSNSELLLSDFGIAVVTHSSRSLGTLDKAGTVSYMAPEQLRGKPRPASDQYALAVIVYEWICGTRPFNGTATEVAMQHLLEPPPSLRARLPALSPDVEQVVMTALAKDPEQRFASVRAFAQALTVASKQAHESETIVLLPEPPEPDDFEHKVPEPLPTAPVAQVAGNPPSDDTPTGANTTLQPVGPINTGNNAETDSMPPPQQGPRNTDKLAIPAIVPVATARPWVPPASAQATMRPAVATQSRRISPFLITVLAGLVFLLLIGGLITFASPTLGSLRGLLLGVIPSATVTPASSDLRSTYQLFGVTETPNPGQRQVQARQLSSTSPTQSKTVNATGVRQIAGVQATGTITFYNSQFVDQQVNAGTAFLANGVHIITDRNVDIPNATGTPPDMHTGAASVSAHAESIGPGGNIAPLTINGTCCSTDSSIFAKNLTAFTGGQGPQNFTVVQQSDIDGVARLLETSAQQSFLGQVHPNEKFVTASQCTPAVTSDHAAGDRATNVTVTVKVSCSGEVYDQQAAQMIASNLLKQQAAKTPGPGYALVGNLITTVTQVMVTDPKKGTLLLQVKAEGRWVFQFSDAQKHALASLIAGKSKQEAQAVLVKQPGIARADIVVSGSDRLPTDPTQITIIVQSVPGIPRSTTPTSGPGSPGVLTNTPVSPVGKGLTRNAGSGRLG